MTEIRKCNTCKWWVRHKSGTAEIWDFGVCHGTTPAGAAVPELGVYYPWADTNDDDFCRNHEERAE